MRTFPDESPSLQNRYWPFVPSFSGLSPKFAGFLELPVAEQEDTLRSLRGSAEDHGRFIHESLASIYAYRLGYRDSPCYMNTDDELERKLEQAKIVLERELLDHWLPPVGDCEVAEQGNAARQLRSVAADNRGVAHPLFDYLETEASREAILAFLWCDVVRNEIVDDEVALLVGGQQGLLKSAAAINLYDECGRGELKNFHTYWLRLLLEDIGWDTFLEYRTNERPWFAGVTSNVFTMLLTRPGLKTAAYGHFIISEGWVPPHFTKLLNGMERCGLQHPSSSLYFSAHVKLDPTHTEELIRAVEVQVPALDAPQCREIVRGARISIAGAIAQYDHMLHYLRGVDELRKVASTLR